MTLKELNGEITRKDVIKLRRQIIPNIKAVAELSKTAEFIPTYAVEHFNTLNKQMRKTPLSKMSERELRNYYRDLMYIKDNLKSSTVEGALQVRDEYERLVGSAVKNMTNDEKKEFFSAYDKFYNIVGEKMASRYKYEVLQTLAREYEQTGQVADEDLGKRLADKLNKITAEAGKTDMGFVESQEYVRLHFTEFLKGIRT